MQGQCEHGFVGAYGYYGGGHVRRCSMWGSTGTDRWFKDHPSAPCVCTIHERSSNHYTRVVTCVLCGKYSEWRGAHRLHERAVTEHVCDDCATGGPFSVLASDRCVCCGACSRVVTPSIYYLSQSRREELEGIERQQELINGVCPRCLYDKVLDPLYMTWLPAPPYARPLAGDRGAPNFHFAHETIRTHWPTGREWKRREVSATLSAFWIGGNHESMKALSAALLLAAEAKKAARAIQ